MTQLALPQSIDAGTPIIASEVQSNFVATRDIINGQLEGGVGQNIKADGITAREVEGSVLTASGANLDLQEGVLSAGDLKVTPGAGLTLNYAAGIALIADDNALIHSGLLVVATALVGGSVVVANNASGNPRIDQVVFTLTGWNAGTVSVVQGTPSVGATLDNRTGAAALPAGAVRLADILMPSGFAGPFVQTTHIRDRRPWARGVQAKVGDASGDIALIGSYTDISGLTTRVELSGAPVTVELFGTYQILTSASAKLITSFTVNGVAPSSWTSGMPERQLFGAGAISGGSDWMSFYAVWENTAPGAGSFNFIPRLAESSNDIVVSRSAGTGGALYLRIKEDLRQNAANSGA